MLETISYYTQEAPVLIDDFTARQTLTRLAGQFIPKDFPDGMDATDPMAAYLFSIKDFPRGLAREEEKHLFYLYRLGVRGAFEVLVLANQGIVVTCAKEYQGGGLGLPELISSGNDGLLRAVAGFQPEKGGFASYAFASVRRALWTALDDQNALGGKGINWPRKKTFEKVTGALMQQRGKESVMEEAAEVMGLPYDFVHNLAQMVQMTACPIWLDHPVAGEDGDDILEGAFADPQSPDPQNLAEENDLRYSLESLLASILTPKEEKVLRLRFGLGGGEPHSLQKIGDRFGLSRQRICQIQAQALGKLHDDPRAEGLL